jgi:hypothetical protein
MTGSGKSRSRGRQQVPPLFTRCPWALPTTAPPTSVVASRQLEELRVLYRLVATKQRWGCASRRCRGRTAPQTWGTLDITTPTQLTRRRYKPSVLSAVVGRARWAWSLSRPTMLSGPARKFVRGRRSRLALLGLLRSAAWPRRSGGVRRYLGGPPAAALDGRSPQAAPAPPRRRSPLGAAPPRPRARSPGPGWRWHTRRSARPG